MAVGYFVPMAHVEDPMSAPPIRWGVVGPGGIASDFTRAVTRHTQSQVVAVGSRSQERAERFAGEWGIPRAYAGYQALVEDPQVEAVYVASPHSEHLEHALLAIEAGKHVLVEKAFTRNAPEAERLFDAARAAGLFVMEAMWARFLPHMVSARDAIGLGDIGVVIGLIADHGQNMDKLPPTHRLHNPELAGGALLDLGVYPVSFAHDMLGVPDRIRAIGSVTGTGVDGQVSMALGFGENVQASLHTTLWARTATTAVVFGSEGRIEFGHDFYRPGGFQIIRDAGARVAFSGEVQDGLQFEAAEVARCIHEGRQESPLMTWQGTLDVMRTMDEVRRQIGVAYPEE